MRIRTVLLPLAIAGVAALVWIFHPSPVRPAKAADAGQPQTRFPSAKFQGAISCAAAACHNGNDMRRVVGSEYSIWVTRDKKHTRAYEILSEKPSKEILEKLGGNRRVEQCYTCHGFHTADGERGDRLLAGVPEKKHRERIVHEILSEGVSCEQCHGPSGNWRATHYQGLPDADRAPGMICRETLVERVTVCAACHIGDGKKFGDAVREVNHDMIAAGHPRLMFEYTAYYSLMPPHWIEKEKGYEARAWLIGQIASARTAVELLRTRAERAAKQEKNACWPEFSETSCYACHHTLQTDRKSRRRGEMPWSEWYVTIPEVLARSLPMPDSADGKPFEKLKSLMNSLASNPRAVAREAEHVRDFLDAWLARLQQDNTVANVDFAALQKQLIANAKESKDEFPVNIPDWDAAAQRFLGVAALERGLCRKSGAERPDASRSLEALRDKLLFPKDRDGPKDDFTPKQVTDLLSQFPSRPDQ